MKRIFSLLSVFLILAACSPQVTVTPEATLTPPPPTVTPLPTLTPTPIAVDGIAENAEGNKLAYLDGEWVVLPDLDGEYKLIADADGVRALDENGAVKYTLDMMTGEWVEVVQAVEISTMEEFEREWYHEEGKIIKVADLYGAGAATITVEKVEIPEPGQELTYEKLDWLDQRAVTLGNSNIRVDGLTLMNLTVEGKSLLAVDLDDNSLAADGDWCLFRLGALLDGRQVSFDLVVNGNVFQGTTGRSIYDNWGIGDIVNNLLLLFFPLGNVSFADLEMHRNKNGLSDEEIKVGLTDVLGPSSTGFTKKDIFRVIREGGLLDKQRVYVGFVR
jgi:hypothetical protein